MLASSTFTYQTRIMTASDSRSLLDQYAALYGKVERTLFAALAAGKSAAALKPGFCKRFDITSRQYNAISMCLKGKIASIQERRKGVIQEAKIKISEIKKASQKLEKVKPKDESHKKRIDFSLHQKKRGLDRKTSASPLGQFSVSVNSPPLPRNADTVRPPSHVLIGYVRHPCCK